MSSREADEVPILADTSAISRTDNPNKINRGGTSRIECLDLLRGLIMLVMAWDHVKDGLLVTMPVSAFQYWCGPYADFDDNIGYFIARWVSNICAPGFFYTMGIGMVMYTQSRLRKGQTTVSIILHFALRGVVLLFVGRWINIPGMFANLVDYSYGLPVPAPLVGGNMTLPQIVQFGCSGIYQVMEALAFTMMIAGLLVCEVVRRPRVGVSLCFVAGLGCFIISNAYIIDNQGDPISTITAPFPRCYAPVNTFGEVLTRIFVAPGVMNPMSLYIYPVVPWIGITLFGFAHGIWFLKDPDRAAYGSWMIAGGTLSLFCVLRAGGGVLGNLRGPPRGEKPAMYVNGFISALNVTKYPPSPTYFLFTISIDMLLLWMLHSISQWLVFQPVASQVSNINESSEGSGSTLRRFLDNALQFLLIFGRVPLFFYAWHFWVIGITGMVFHLVHVRGLQYWQLPFVWLFVILVMVVPCRMFAAFKATTAPTSLWRLF